MDEFIGHRANILNGLLRDSGIGVSPGTPQGGSGGTYVHDFGGPCLLVSVAPREALSRLAIPIVCLPYTLIRASLAND